MFHNSGSVGHIVRDHLGKKQKKQKKIEKREIGIKTEREEIVEEKIEKRNVEILTEEEMVVEKIVEEKKEVELRE